MELGKIKKILSRVRELPTLPVIAQKVNALIADPRTKTADLAEVVEKDQSITANILKLVNSAYYSLPERVSSIPQAISLLGFKNISHMAMTLAVFDSLRGVKGGSFSRKEFWMHSIATAILGSKIAEACGCPSKEDVFTAGLLHDLGKVFMDAFLHEEFTEAVKKADESSISFYEAEHQLDGVDHARIGEWIARAWRLPIFIVAVIRHHHQEPEERSGLFISGDTVVDCVRAADVAVRSARIGNNGDGGLYKPIFNVDLLKRLPIFMEDVSGFMKEMQKELAKSATLLMIAAGE